MKAISIFFSNQDNRHKFYSLMLSKQVRYNFSTEENQGIYVEYDVDDKNVISNCN